MSHKPTLSPQVASGLFIAAGAMWCLAAWMGKEAAFYGVGAMFVLLGIANLARARRGGAS